MTTKVINQVYETTDYSLFKTLEGNRSVQKLHVKRLKDSFQIQKLQSPIIVNEKFEIIDGQHRFNASKDLGLPVDYIVCNNYGLKEVQQLNSNSSNWKSMDYLNAFCDMGHQEYIKFRNFMNEYPDFGFRACEMLLTLRSTGRKQGVDRENAETKNGRVLIKYFENGELEIPDLKLSKKYAAMLMQIKPFFTEFAQSGFVGTMIGMFKNENYEHDVFIKRLKAQPNALYPCKNREQYKLLIEEIYNHKSRNKVSLRF